MQLRPYQEKSIEEIRKAWAKGNKRVLLILPTGCHENNETIMLHDGSFKLAKDVTTNDLLLGIDGSPRKILKLHKGIKPGYKITPKNGEPFTVTEDHILSLIKDTDEIIDISVKDYINLSEDQKHILKLFSPNEMNFSKQDKLPIDPYFLGTFIGDDYLFCENKDLIKELQELNLFTKDTIPLKYKMSSIRERLMLLAGLLDANGNTVKNNYRYTTKYQLLAQDISFVCRSLGLKVKVSKNNNNYYDILITGDCFKIPCKYIKSQPRRKKNVLRTSFTVEPVGEIEYTGFTVDKDNRYLLKDFIVTHNCGKTIVFSELTNKIVQKGNKVLILAHRGELLEQAQTKLGYFNIDSSLEKGTFTADPNAQVVVASVQSLSRDNRLEKFPKGYFKTIIIDECHHSMSDTYKKIINYFDNAYVLGVTATPDRADEQDLSEIFPVTAFEYSIKDAIKDGFLSPIKTKFIKTKLNLKDINFRSGDYAPEEVGAMLENSLEKLAKEIKKNCKDRKTVVFVPLVSTARKFEEIFNNLGMKAISVAGEDKDRKERIEAFAKNEFNVIISSLLLGEGWDCPSVNCVVCLRPTESRGLYCLDEETEILTQNGWKKDVQTGEIVASYNINEKKIVYSPALNVIRRPLEEDECFYHFSNNYVDFRVTNKHRMIFKTRNAARKNKEYKIDTIENIVGFKDGIYLPIASHNQFKGVNLTDEEIKFIAWVITDGCINKANNAIQISQSTKHPWCEEISQILDKCNLKYGCDLRNGNTNFKSSAPLKRWWISKGTPRGTFKERRGWGYLEEYLSKDISPLLFQMNDHQFEIFLETINLADGNKFETKEWKKQSYDISKGNKKFIENLQIMAIQRGYKANVTTFIKNKINPLYTIHIKKKDFACINSASDNRTKIIKENYKPENCWCITTELGTIITRRNGKVTIMGNCQIIGRGLRLSPETNKTDCLVLDFLWLTGHHSLCRPASLFTDNLEVANQVSSKKQDIETMDELFDEIEEAKEVVEEKKKQLEMERTNSMLKKVQEASDNAERLQYFKDNGVDDTICKGCVNPGYFVKLVVSKEEQGDFYRTKYGKSRNFNFEHLKYLASKGIKATDISTSEMENYLYDLIVKRENQKLATPKQIFILSLKKIQTNYSTVTSSQASFLLRSKK